jgi:hypothetical protein
MESYLIYKILLLLDGSVHLLVLEGIMSGTLHENGRLLLFQDLLIVFRLYSHS